ncbi:MAG: DNA double-strand break repair nuclease NurA [Metallosphaera yellowstonensis]|jgi:NurA domain.
MSARGGLSELLSGLVAKYIAFQFDSLPLDGQPTILEESKLLNNLEEALGELDPQVQDPGEILAMDGSSRSFLSSRGLVSVSSVALVSNIKGVIGLFPSFEQSRTLDLSDPFIAVVGGFRSSSRIEDFLGSPFVANYSTDGTSLSPEVIRTLESELRFGLETSFMSRVKGDRLVLVDGPLFPNLLFLPKSHREKLIDARKRAVRKNFVGIVKRLNASKILVSALGDPEVIRDFRSKFGVNPLVFSSDEGLLTYLAMKNLKPPFRVMKIGPIQRTLYDTKVYSGYLIIPFHPYVKKFSILRIESLQEGDLWEKVGTLPITGDGIPKVLAMSDKAAKEMSNAIYSLLISSLTLNGIQESFYSRLEGAPS